MSNLPPDTTLPRANRADLIGSQTAETFAPLLELPPPPEYLNARAIVIWNEIGPVMLDARMLHETDLHALARYSDIEAKSRLFNGELELVNLAHKLGTALGITGPQSKLRVVALKGRQANDADAVGRAGLADVIRRLNA